MVHAGTGWNVSRVTGTMRAMRGLMQDVPLTIDTIFRHAEQHHGDVPIVTNNPGGKVRSTYGEWAQRTRRLGGVFQTLGITADGRIGTFGWNSQRHLELYFAGPCTGRVVHTLNIRLFPEQLTYIANHAEDEVVFVDRTVLPLLWPLIDTMKTIQHVVVMVSTSFQKSGSSERSTKTTSSSAWLAM